MENEKEYGEAGKAAWKALQAGAKMVKPGARLLDVAESVEKGILKTCGLAFPANISIDNQAAHYTPGIGDEAVFGDKDVVKIDCGAEVDGFVGDCALTVDLSGENGKLVEASEKALENVIAMIRQGVDSGSLGAEIEKTISGYGFLPVRNLGGHVLDEYVLHTGYTVPNIPVTGGFALEEGMAIAIEPFATMGDGKVTEERRVEIFSLERAVPVRNADARKVLAFVEEEHESFPFAERWLARVCSGFRLKAALKELIQKEVFKGYPILSDTGLVSQAEKTIIVTKDGCEVTTK